MPNGGVLGIEGGGATSELLGAHRPRGFNLWAWYCNRHKFYHRAA